MFICTMFGKVWTDNPQVGHKNGDIDMFDKCHSLIVQLISLGLFSDRKKQLVVKAVSMNK